MLTEAHIASRDSKGNPSYFYELENHALSKSRANHPFLMYEGQQWTYKETYDIALKYGTWFNEEFGVQRGDVVAIDSMNCPQFIFIWLGLWSIGAKPAFINYNLTNEPLIHSVRTSCAKLLLVEEAVRTKWTGGEHETLASDPKRPVEIVVFNPSIEAQIISTNGIRQPDSVRDGEKTTDMATLIYTSGTTGLPKAAIVSWAKVRRSGWFSVWWLGLKDTDRFYTCMPLYHSSAFLLCVITSLTKGSTAIIGRRFSTKTFWQDVRQHDATLIQYVGETCRYLLSAPPQIDPVSGENLDRKNHVRIAFGNGLRPDVWEKFKTRFGIDTIAEFYGSTEGPLALWNLSSNSLTSGAIGRTGFLTQLLPDRKFSLVQIDWSTESPWRDPSNNHFCKRVERGAPGELLMELDSNDPSAKFHGYYGNAKASQSKLLRDVFVKGDAFFRTGDVMSHDREGRWWFLDRMGDTYRWKSENVSTTEVSQVLGTHPRIAEANVYGVQLPHHDGRAGCAALELNSSSLNGKEAGALMADISAHAVHRLPKYAVPQFIRLVQQMERTGNNKQTKATLRNGGVDPANLEAGESLWWLNNGRFVPFQEVEWKKLSGGQLKL